MSDADNPSFAGFGKLVPGFDFLQNLAKQAASSASQSNSQMPNLGSWIAPTLNVEELDKRIEELKAVQFWLDQNAMALKATIQALEVQKMTLATLKGMNFNMSEVANAFKFKVADPVAGGGQKAAEKATPFSSFDILPTAFQEREADAQAEAAKVKPKVDKAAADATGGVDPMQWWGALTQQFQNIASTAMQDAANKAALSSGQHLAKDSVKGATDVARQMAQGMADSAGKTVARGARSAMGTALRSAQAWPVPGSMPVAASKPRAASKPKAPARKTAAKTPAKAAKKTSR